MSKWLSGLPGMNLGFLCQKIPFLIHLVQSLSRFLLLIITQLRLPNRDLQKPVAVDVGSYYYCSGYFLYMLPSTHMANFKFNQQLNNNEININRLICSYLPTPVQTLKAQQMTNNLISGKSLTVILLRNIKYSLKGYNFKFTSFYNYDTFKNIQKQSYWIRLTKKK